MDTITTFVPSQHTSKCNCEDCFINLIASQHLAPTICDKLYDSKKEAKFKQGDVLIEEGKNIDRF